MPSDGGIYHDKCTRLPVFACILQITHEINKTVVFGINDRKALIKSSLMVSRSPLSDKN